MLGFLPPVCSKLFSTVTLTCPQCLATCTAPCFFNTHVTWAMTEWVDLATALAEATMHPWVQSQGWHAEGCNISQHLIDLKTMTSWVLLQLQPDQHDRYPFVCDSMNLTKDQSLLRINATITGFLCSNSRSQQDRHRHYWVVEFENGIPRYVYDSLQGKQRLTTELAKRLRVFGVLLNVGNEHVPFLRTKYLDEAAGIVPAIHRGRNPIVVLGRGRIQWARNALCKKHKVPTPKKGRVQKHILKGSKQNHPNGKPIMTRSTKGPTAEKKSGRSHLPTKPGKRQARSARKTLPWLFSQASGAPFSQGHRAEENSQILEISDDSDSENHLEAEPGELQNDLPLSDPISEFSSLREPSGVVVMVEPQIAPLLKVSLSPLSLENDRDRPSLLVVSHGNRRNVLKLLTMRRKNPQLLHGKLVPLPILKMQFPHLSVKLVLQVMIRPLAPLHGKLVPMLGLLLLLTPPNMLLVPQLFLMMNV